jgi:hypothetical protein
LGLDYRHSFNDISFLRVQDRFFEVPLTKCSDKYMHCTYAGCAVHKVKLSFPFNIGRLPRNDRHQVAGEHTLFLHDSLCSPRMSKESSESKPKSNPRISNPPQRSCVSPFCSTRFCATLDRTSHPRRKLQTLTPSPPHSL